MKIQSLSPSFFTFDPELFQLADYYGEEDLKGRCVQQLKVLITDENVSKVYAASFLYNVKVSKTTTLPVTFR